MYGHPVFIQWSSGLDFPHRSKVIQKWQRAPQLLPWFLLLRLCFLQFKKHSVGPVSQFDHNEIVADLSP